MPNPQAIFTYDPPTVVKARRYTIKPNQEMFFAGGQVPRHRRQFILTNPGAEKPNLGMNNLQIRSKLTGAFTDASMLEPDDGYAVLVYHDTSIALFTNADLVVRNPSDSATVSFMVCEIFYS